MSNPNLHRFTCEMDLARTYLAHGKLAVAFSAAEAAWDAAFVLNDDSRMQKAINLLSDISALAVAA